MIISRDNLRALGDITEVARQRDGVLLSLTGGALLHLTFSATIVRVRFLSGDTDTENDPSYAVTSHLHGEEVFIAEAEETVEIIAISGVRVVAVREGCLLSIFDPEGRLVVEDFQPPAFDPNGGFIETSKRREADERYFGLGEKAKSSRDTRSFVMWNTDTYAYPPGTDPIYQSIPFFIAVRNRLAYGIFFDNTYRSFFDMGHTAEGLYSFGATGGELNYYIFTGGRERSPRNILADYTTLTGRCPLPPLWALGYQQSRWSYYPQDRVRDLARQFREKRIPADVIYLDIDYMDEFRVFTWNQAHFPDPKQLTSDLMADGFRLVVIVDPGIKADENYRIYCEGRDRGHFCQTHEGNELRAQVWPGTCAFPDFTNPTTREWFGNLYEQHLDEGVSGFWNDMNEPSVFPAGDTQEDGFDLPQKTFPLSVRHAGDGKPSHHARYHNVYGMQMARTTYEAVKHLRPERRPFVLTRAGFAGVQRYSAVWTGDNVATWEHLALSIPMLCNLGISGVPFVGADIGGFAGNPSSELFTRWLQAAALTPFCRSHAEIGTNDREPWSHGDEFEAINRSTIELRYQLLPFIYSLFYEHERSGAPVMRPLWFEYPVDEQAYTVEDQFLLGPDLLVAPVLNEGSVTRNVYFPRGDQWRDWWTGALYEGGTQVDVDAPIDRLPMFARVGAAIPIQPVVQHTGEMKHVPLGLAVVSSALPSTVSFYEDLGDGFDYQSGAFSLAEIQHSLGMLCFQRSGDFDLRRSVGYVELLGFEAAPEEIKFKNQPITNGTFNEATRRLLIPLPVSGDSWVLSYSIR